MLVFCGKIYFFVLTFLNALFLSWDTNIDNTLLFNILIITFNKEVAQKVTWESVREDIKFVEFLVSFS